MTDQPHPTEASTEAQPLRIEIELHPNGDLQVKGPVSDPVLFFGMLEMARARVVMQMTMGQFHREVVKAEAKAKIWTPDGIKVVQ